MAQTFENKRRNWRRAQIVRTMNYQFEAAKKVAAKEAQ